MDLHSALYSDIAAELGRQRSLSVDGLLQMIRAGQAESAADHLVLLSPPDQFRARLLAVRQALEDEFLGAGAERRRNCVAFLTHVSLDLCSFLVRWNLCGAACGDAALTETEVDAEIEKNLALLAQWEASDGPLAGEVLELWKAEAKARFVAEKAHDPGALAADLTGRSLCDYVRNMARAFGRSNLRQIAEMQAAGQNETELGNDYAAFLKYTMYLGVSFVTTNPVLVDIAWEADPAIWDPVMDRVVADNPQADDQELARLATLEVVLANMRLLRPIFLLTNGATGCVSLQVNPKKHDDAAAMISDAVSIYSDLRTRLNGGVPNVVFKLPGTLAGLVACRDLTARGIGVNITVNFGLFQQIRFAEAIAQGNAIYCTLTEMNGRLAYPVRDELLALLPQLAAEGVSEADVREAAAWSGVAVLKKLHLLLEKRGYDLRRIKPLVASLRVYKDGPGYDRLPSPYPDITEGVGTRIITVFPDVRHVFDAEPQVILEADRVHAPVPEGVMRVLAHSQIFRQAYYVEDKRWMETEDEHLRPQTPLSLEDEAGVVAWPPVRDTLRQFGASYDRFVQRLVGRRTSVSGH